MGKLDRNIHRNNKNNSFTNKKKKVSKRAASVGHRGASHASE